MSYIVDTHVILWTIFSPNKISSKAKTILIQPEPIKFVSIVSFWEISLKFSLGKIDLKGIKPDDIPDLAKKSHFEILNLNFDVASSYHKLPYGKHKDPFDRMLAWQTIREGYTLLSSDKDFITYKEHGLKVLW